MTPFFSIGVTTYNRVDMLKECLDSLRRQTFSDFEVIVGNDYVQGPLSAGDLLIDDSRFRIVNYPSNIGEHANFRRLLEMSSGRYFTWLADDDMYAPAFLKAVHAAIMSCGTPARVITGFVQGKNFNDRLSECNDQPKIFHGRKFLNDYLSEKIRTIGFYHVFRSDYLRDIHGGIEDLGCGFSPYSDNLLTIRAGQEAKVVYLDAPLIFYRTHEQSISWASKDAKAYSTAQFDMLKHVIPILLHESVKDDFQVNLLLLMKQFVRDYAGVLTRQDRLSWRLWVDYKRMMLEVPGIPSDVRRSLGVMLREKTGMLVRKFFNAWVRRRILDPLVAFKHCLFGNKTTPNEGLV